MRKRKVTARGYQLPVFSETPSQLSIFPELALKDLTFVAFDLETTGLFSACARIVEIAGVKIREQNLTSESFWSMVNPQTPIPSAAKRIHGIGDEDVRNSPTCREVLPKFVNFTKGCILVAHNASYDLEVLFAEFERIKIRPRGWLCVDTYAWARKVFNAPNYKLSTLGNMLSIGDVSYHRAKEDVRVTSILFCELAGRFGWTKTLKELSEQFPDVVISADDIATPEEFELPEGLETLAVALQEGADVLMVYGGQNRRLIEMRVAPRTIIKRRRTLYMEAWCHKTHQLKTFRLDRIHEVRTLD